MTTLNHIVRTFFEVFTNQVGHDRRLGNWSLSTPNIANKIIFIDALQK